MKLFSRLLDKRLAAYQRELIETHYKEVDNMYRQMRGWRHDYRGHIQTMKVLAAQGDLEGVRAYLDKLDTDLNTVDLAIKTGNPMADAILNSKISLARAQGIPVKADARVPVALALSELEPESFGFRGCPGLYFVGETLDCAGTCGGFNLHWAFGSGLVAGRDAARPRPGKKR